MTDKYADLRAALDAGPTPGPWKANTSNGIGPISEEDDQSFGMVLPVCFAEFENAEANRRYIAACHPDTIRALLADYDRMRQQLEWIEHYARDSLTTDSRDVNDWYGDAECIASSARAALAQEQGGSDE